MDRRTACLLATLVACAPNRDGQLERFASESERLAAAECACGAAPAGGICAGRRALATGFDEDCIAAGFVSDPPSSARIGCELGVLRQLADCLETDCSCPDEAALRATLASCGLRSEVFEGLFWASYLDCYAAGVGACPSGPMLDGAGPFVAGALDGAGDAITPTCAPSGGLPDRSYMVPAGTGPRHVTLTLPAGITAEQGLSLAALGSCDGAELACLHLTPGASTTLEVPTAGAFVLVLDGHLRDDAELAIATP